MQRGRLSLDVEVTFLQCFNACFLVFTLSARLLPHIDNDNFVNGMQNSSVPKHSINCYHNSKSAAPCQHSTFTERSCGRTLMLLVEAQEKHLIYGKITFQKSPKAFPWRFMRYCRTTYTQKNKPVMLK